MALWGGRFDSEIDAGFKFFNDSLRFDVRLFKQDIEGSVAWSKALCAAGILSVEEQSSLEGALHQVYHDYSDNIKAIVDSGEEDIHSWVEAQLIARVGDLGKKLHTGRSRNDQVATDLRLWCRAALGRTTQKLQALLGAVIDFAKNNKHIIFPGYTHLQRAQPVSVAHWALAYGEMLKRDIARFEQVRQFSSECPLGSAALSGTSFAVDRHALSEALQFHKPTSNSIDAVSDRDYVIEYLYAASMTIMHLSRLSEDVIFYTSKECQYFGLSDEFATGSSLMPQKKNPDAFELIRGKTGRIYGHLNALMITMKGLPTAYNKDLQEDKEGLFDSVEQLHLCLDVMQGLIKSITVNAEQCKSALQGGFLNATDLAEYLVKKGVPFRESHDLVGKATNYAEQRSLPLEALSLTELKQFSDKIGDDVYVYINPNSINEHRNVYGGTALTQIEQAISESENFLDHHPLHSQWKITPATIADVDELEELISYWAHKGENLHRARQEIINQIQEFLVARNERGVLGCGSLFVYHDDLAEIRSLGITPSYQKRGIGKELVRAFIEKARELNIKKVFVLTRVPHFFADCGFERSCKSLLPEKVLKDCNLCPKLHACDETAMIYHVM